MDDFMIKLCVPHSDMSWIDIFLFEAAASMFEEQTKK